MALTAAQRGEKVQIAEVAMTAAEPALGLFTDGENVPKLIACLMHYARAYDYDADADALIELGREQYQRDID